MQRLAANAFGWAGEPGGSHARGATAVALLWRRERWPGDERLPQLIHKPALAHARLAIDIHQPGELAGEDRRDRALELDKLIRTADQRAGIAKRTGRHRPCADQPRHRHQRALALHLQRGQIGPLKHIGDGLLDAPTRKHLARRGGHHQARRQINRIAERTIGAAGRAAIGAGEHGSDRNADLAGANEAKLRRRRAQLQRRCHGAAGIIFMRSRRTERGIQVAALIADRKLNQRAAIARQHILHPANIAIQLIFRQLIVLVSNPIEA